MTTDDPRGDAVAKLHDDLAIAGRLQHDATKRDAVARIHAAATIELVEAVRDLAALVALAVAPTLASSTNVDESDAESAGGADAAEAGDDRDFVTLGSLASTLVVGDVVQLVAAGDHGDGVVAVTAAGIDQGSPWLELREGAIDRRLFVDVLERDERVVLALNGEPVGEAEAGIAYAQEAELVTKHAPVDADDDDFFGDESDEGEGGDDDDFDTVV